METGVAKKICSQALYWQRAGHRVALVAPALSSRPIEAARNLEIIEFEHPLGSLKYLNRQGLGIREIRRYRPDIIYNRYFILPPWHLALMSRFRLVFEINSEESEFALYHSRVKRLYHGLTRSWYLQGAAGAVFISHELSEKSAFSEIGRRVVIANGVLKPGRDEAEGFHREPGPRRLFFVGNGCFPWHGIDKLMVIARHLPDVQVDVVGDPYLDDGPPNVRFHGPLPANEYLPMLRRADVAVGPLSLHTKSLAEASPLKVREYLANGIPSVIAYRDTDIAPGTELTLHIPNSPDNVPSSLDRIAAFIDAAAGRRVRWSAVRTIDAETKEENRLAFFDQCRAGRSIAEAA
ncbi:MAG: glycosyltransferase [Planctomycetaceae bacterium]|nr:glycosyltransferase [Planctomycetaceae bacterium]